MEAHSEWQAPAGSWASSAGNRRSMLSNRGRDTGPELAVRRLLHRAGLRYRVNVRPVSSIRRKADVIFPRLKVAVFIDGCFWHGCPNDFVMPKSNIVYWRAKIEGNQRRDIETTAALRSLGWTVLRFWTHEDPTFIASEISRTVRHMQRTA